VIDFLRYFDSRQLGDGISPVMSVDDQ